MPSYVVTGASRGLGYAFVKHLAAIEGNTVIGIARNKPATEERFAKDGVKNVTILAADITDVKALQKAAEETAKITGGSLDCLINNAGLVSERSRWKTLVDDTAEGLEEDLISSFRANVVGVAHTTNAFLPLLRKGQAKKVLTLSTGLADADLINEYALAPAAPYSISKVAVNMLVAKYNAALGESEGILFFAISPGFVDTYEGREQTQEDVEGFKVIGEKFAKYAPHFKGSLSPEESVKMQMEVLEKATVKTHGGAFVSHLGNKQWL
jgi:NAD(P)-dependent dehydrogenase (short-subunit alcohol dehydrogenase family)